MGRVHISQTRVVIFCVTLSLQMVRIMNRVLLNKNTFRWETVSFVSCVIPKSSSDKCYFRVMEVVLLKHQPQWLATGRTAMPEQISELATLLEYLLRFVECHAPLQGNLCCRASVSNS